MKLDLQDVKELVSLLDVYKRQEQRLGKMIRENRYLTDEEQEPLQPVSGKEPAQMSGELPEESLEGLSLIHI